GWCFEARGGGGRAADLVLLLHGFPQTAHSWRRVLPALARGGYRAVAPHLRGVSPGARPAERAAYAAGPLVTDVLAIADELGAPRFHLVGHDWGGALAWQVAARHPDRLRSLCALPTPPAPPFP